MTRYKVLARHHQYAVSVAESCQRQLSPDITFGLLHKSFSQFHQSSVFLSGILRTLAASSVPSPGKEQNLNSKDFSYYSKSTNQSRKLYQ